ncbi:MAG: methionyl-tRNA formyltransferase [Rikenellaceae bacterium]|nr:methionyl-tRNA formyltransferase [Rikenellaceae bacterium]
MDVGSLRILFMGTPEFAVASLARLVDEGYNVVAVVTAPDRPAGRGQKPRPSAVKQYATEAGLPVLQPEKLRDPEFLAQLAELDIDLGIVIAFRMLPEVVWAMPRLGTFNLHASLLPQYRGAAPINWAIINGETTTGLTTFMLNAEIDKGDIIGRVEMPILPTDNAGSLHDRLMEAGTELVTLTVERIASGNTTPLRQMDIAENTLKPAPKIFKEDCRVVWSRFGWDIANLVRGLAPYPAAWSVLWDGEAEVGSFKIFDATFTPEAHDTDLAGTVDLTSKNALRVACADGWIAITDIQPAGKRRMTASEWRNGVDKTANYKFR